VGPTTHRQPPGGAAYAAADRSPGQNPARALVDCGAGPCRGVILGYGVAEWNFAHACSDAMVTATRFEDGMGPFISHPDDETARSRLLELLTGYGRELASCRQSFFFR
jgi:hypothetical protein